MYKFGVILSFYKEQKGQPLLKYVSNIELHGEALTVLAYGSIRGHLHAIAVSTHHHQPSTTLHELLATVTRPQHGVRVLALACEVLQVVRLNGEVEQRHPQCRVVLDEGPYTEVELNRAAE